VKAGSAYSQLPIHYSWVVLGSATLAVVGALGLARFGYTLVLPSMQSGLGLDNTQAGILASASLIGYLILSLVGGVLAARFGPRSVVTAGLLITGAGMILTGMVHSFLPAALWLAVTGLGSGTVNVPAMGLMTAWFAAKRRGLATGIAVAGSSLALIVIGPLVPRILTAYGDDGWRVCWTIFGAATLAFAVLVWLFLRNDPEELGIKPLGAESGAVLLTNASDRLQWGLVYRSTVVWHLGLVYIAFGFSYIIYLTFFTKRLVAEGGFSTESAGTLFMVLGWFSLLCGLIWGAVSDRLGRRTALIIVYLLQAIAFGAFALANTPAVFTFSVILFGLTAWSIPAIMAAACGDVLGARMAPAALGFLTLFFGVGQAVGPSVAGAMADAAGSFVPAYMLASAVAFIGACGAYLLRSSVSTAPVTGDVQ